MTPIETAAMQGIQLMDLTSLNSDDDISQIRLLCESANTPAGPVAAICIYPQFITTARQILDQHQLKDVKIATVTNFPRGEDDIEKARVETRHAVQAGADEIDVVYPYSRLMAGDKRTGQRLVAACKQECGDQAILKVIIESGVLSSPELIRQASESAIAGGADFLKTSTGKVEINATLEAAEIMLNSIKDSGRQDLGFKAAGGVRSAEEVQAYLSLARKIMGDQWISSRHFRFGASSLLTTLTATLASTALSELGNE